MSDNAYSSKQVDVLISHMGYGVEGARTVKHLARIAAKLTRLNETACNRDLNGSESLEFHLLRSRAADLIIDLGLKLNHFNTDPRGYSVYVDLPDGYSNTWGGTEHGFGL